MNSELQKVIESLRLGVPPNGHVRYFTIGRVEEIAELTTRLKLEESGALLLKANYGSGKSHLLRFIRETALKENFAVSSVTLDAKSAVRFNRMDQILGAILRGLEVPGDLGSKGVRPFFDFVCQQAHESTGKDGKQWQQITNNGQWDYSKVLESPAIFIALRAWASGRVKKELLQDWLFQTGGYKATNLYHALVEKINRYYRLELAVNCSPHWRAYTTKTLTFSFQSQGYVQCWAALRDLYVLACASGLRGLIVLFDEFEDVLSNIKNITHQETAFQNLFDFFAGQQVRGMSFFAVTPEFVDKCKERILSRGRWNYSYSQFDRLSTFEMSPLEKVHLQDLVKKIREMHGIAYSWDTNSPIIESGLHGVVTKAASIAVQDRTRQTIRETVKFLDRWLEESE